MMKVLSLSLLLVCASCMLAVSHAATTRRAFVGTGLEVHGFIGRQNNNDKASTTKTTKKPNDSKTLVVSTGKATTSSTRRRALPQSHRLCSADTDDYVAFCGL